MEEIDHDVAAKPLITLPMRTKLLGAGSIYFSIFLAFYYASAPVGSVATGALIVVDEHTDTHTWIHLYEYESGRVRWLWSTSMSPECYVTAATLIDMNADGRPEILVSVDTSLLVYEDKSGTYELVMNQTLQAGTSSFLGHVRSRAIDFFGNGTEYVLTPFMNDLVLVGYEGGRPVVKGEAFPAGNYGFDVGDVNHDGMSDIVHAAPHIWNLTVRENNGGGNYSEVLLLGREVNQYYMPTPIDEIRIGDVTGDGDNEIVMVGAGAKPLSVWEYSANQYREKWSHETEGSTLIQSLDLGDLDGDGVLEIVVSAEAGEGAGRGLTVWDYDESDSSFVALWEDEETILGYGSAYEGLRLLGMQNLRVVSTDQGRAPTIFGLVSGLSTQRESDPYLYVAERTETGFSISTARLRGSDLIQGAVMDVWPLEGAEVPEMDWDTIEPTWTAKAGGPLRDRADSIVQCQDGGFILVGRTRANSTREGDSLVFKVDGGGQTVWERAYETQIDYEALDAVECLDGGIILVGRRQNIGMSHGPEGYAMKLDYEGHSMWERSYGDLDCEELTEIVRSQDGGYLLLGTMPIWSDHDSILLHIDEEGGVLWTSHDVGVAMVSDPSGGYVLAGYPGDSPSVTRIDSSGEVIWEREYTITGGLVPMDLARAKDGGYVIVGRTKPDEGLPDACALKISATGDKIWELSFGGPGWDYARCVGTDGDGYLVAGGTWSAGAGSGDVYVARISTDGKLIWEGTVGGVGHDQIEGLVSSGDGGWILAGHTWSGSSGLSDVYYLKLEGDPYPLLGLKLTPSEIAPTGTGSVLAEVRVDVSAHGWGEVSKVWLDIPSLGLADLPMTDDGTDADRAALDHVYSAAIPVTRESPSGRHLVISRLVDRMGRTAYTSSQLSIYPTGSITVFDEGSEDWSPMGNMATVTIDGSRALSGSSSMFVSCSAQGFVDFIPPGGYPLDAIGLSAIEFAVMPVDSRRFRPIISVGVDDVESVVRLDLYSKGYRFNNNEWTTVSVDLESLGAKDQRLTFIRLEMPVQGAFYLDRVELTAATEPIGFIAPAILGIVITGIIPNTNRGR